MSVSSRTAGLLAAAFFSTFVPTALARRQMNSPRPQLMAVNSAQNGGRQGGNVATVGNAAQMQQPYLSYMTGGSPGAGLNIPLMAGGGNPTSPYALSTMGGYNPYFGSGAGMSNSPYSLSTSPGGGQGGGYGGFGYGFTPNSLGYGYGLLGIADYTRASGQYWKDIQQARMTQEKVRQEVMETARRRIQFEAWYETMRPTAAKMRDAEMTAELDRARRDPPDVEVQSGRALNTLLSSIQRFGKLDRAASSGLSDEVLKHINLTAGTSSGNVGMLKDVSKIEWPEALLDQGYDEMRKRLTSNLRKAVDSVKDRERPTSAVRKDIDIDFAEMNKKISESADEMPVGQYIDAKRFMNQLASAIKALKDPKVDNYFNNTWTAKGKTVAELVENMTKDGLTFGPAAPGDEPAYKALYIGMRNFETALQGPGLSSEGR